MKSLSTRNSNLEMAEDFPFPTEFFALLTLKCFPHYVKEWLCGQTTLNAVHMAWTK